MIIREYGRKAERDGKQARGLRRELRPAGIRTAHDHRQLGQGRIGQLVALQKGIETVIRGAAKPLLSRFWLSLRVGFRITRYFEL